MNGQPRTTAAMRWFAGAILALAVMLVFEPTIDDEFSMIDDYQLIVDNRYMRDDDSPGGWLKNVAYFWRLPRRLDQSLDGMHGMYMPLTYGLWTTLLELSRQHDDGSKPAADLLVASVGTIDNTPTSPVLFHATCMLLHVINALLAWRLISCLARSEIGGWFGAALFALHPTQVEAVAWISETKGLLSSTFALGAMLVYLRPREARTVEDAATAAATPRLRARYALASGLFFAALLAKPAAAAAVLILGVVELVLWRSRLRDAVLRLAPWAAAAVLMAAITKTQQPNSALEFVPLWWQRPLVAGDTMAFYLGHLVLPTTLGQDYGRLPQLVLQGPARWTWIVPAMALAMAAAGPWRRWALAALLMFLAGVAPVTGLVSFAFQQYSTVADRYAYLAMLGPSLGLAALLAWASNSRPRATALVAAGSLVLVAITTLSVRQVARWNDNVSMLGHSTQVNPRSWLCHFNLARLWERAAADPWLQTAAFGLDDSVKRQLVRDPVLAKIAPPHYPQPRRPGALQADRVSGGDPIEALRRHYQQLAMRQYAEVVRIKPDMAVAHCNRANLLMQQGNVNEAIAAFERAVAAMPGQWRLHEQMGTGLLRAGKSADAIIEFKQVVQQTPERFAGHFNLGLAYYRDRQFSESLAALNRAENLSPGRGDVAYFSGLVLLESGDAFKAAAQWRKAMRRGGSPRWAANLAWLLATSDDPRVRQPEESLRWARMVCDKQSAPDARFLAIRAAAEAATGDFRAAQKTAQEAIAILGRSPSDEPERATARDAAIRDSLDEQLQTYRQARPWREPSVQPFFAWEP